MAQQSGHHTLVANRVFVQSEPLANFEEARLRQGTLRKKKATLASGPKFREETPKKGCDRATPIAISHCNNSTAAHKTQAQKDGMAAPFCGYRHARPACLVLERGELCKREAHVPMLQTLSPSLGLMPTFISSSRALLGMGRSPLTDT
jgi:hypothetical protein